MPSVKELREQRNALVPRLREISDKAHNEKRDLTAEEQKNWEDINKEVSRLGGEITRGQTLEDLEKDLNNPGNDRRPGRHDRNGRREQERDRRDKSGKVTQRDRNLAIKGWFRRQAGCDVPKRQADAAKRVGIRPSQKYLDIRLLNQKRLAQYREARAQSAITMGAGGALVADSMAGSLERALLSFTGVRQAGCTIYRTDTGGEFTLPTTDDTSNEGELVGENTVSNDGDFTVGGGLMQAFKFSSKFIKVPEELIEDSSFDIPSLVGTMIGERIARRQNRELTTGTGGNRPRGVVTDSYLGVTAASQNAISSDEVLQLLHSVDPTYRDANGKFMGHDGILLSLRLLKDGDGNYIWKPGMSEGQPDMLFGKPFIVNQHMQSSIATGTKTLLFGDFSHYVIREVRTLRVRRLVERFADADQEGFIGFLRYDGRILDAGTHPIKHLIQA